MASPLLKSTLGHRDQPKVARIKRHCFTKDIVEKLKLFIRLNLFSRLPSRLRFAEKLGQPYKSVKNFLKDWRNSEFPLPMEFSSVDCFGSPFSRYAEKAQSLRLPLPEMQGKHPQRD